jgi:hypothetical protein
MMMTQGIRHSKTSREVVNEKRDEKMAHDFFRDHWMWGADWNEAPDQENRSQESEELQHRGH